MPNFKNCSTCPTKAKCAKAGKCLNKKGYSKGGMTKKKGYAKGGKVAMYNQGGMVKSTGMVNTGIKKG